MVATHVVAETGERLAHGPHEGLRPAAEHLAIEIILRHQAQHYLVEHSPIAGPGPEGIGLFDDPFQIDANDARGHKLHPVAQNDVGRAARAVDENDVRLPPGIVEPSGHRHHRCDA